MKKRLWVFFVIVSMVVLPCIAIGATEGGHGDAPGEAGAKRWVATDTYRVMNFVVLLIILIVLLRKPISQALSGRIKGIQDQLNDLEAKKKEAEKQLAEYNEKLSLLDRQAEDIVAEYIKQGNEAKSRILQEAKSAAEKIEAQARKNIEQEFDAAKEKLQIEVFDKALAQAENMIKENISSEDQDRLVDEYLSKVVLR
jgi:F-type H+-transporting ATPase subunit b